ncbi:MAG: glycoside hydrolase family 71/99-like protein [Rikenellaceae bacterium]
MKRLFLVTLMLAMISSITTVDAAKKSKNKSKYADSSNYMSYTGLVMAGYQGWFNAPGDGAGRGWNHYKSGQNFRPGECTIDAWADVSEYKKLYKTEFKNSDGSAAYTFSSFDKSTVDLHFKWMREYGLDGVFMQRFVTTLKTPVSINHSNVVLRNAFNASDKEHRAISIMYDLSGMQAVDVDIVIEDWKMMVDQMGLASPSDKNNNYLYHNGKPLVAIWGVGFGGGRKYSYPEINKLLDFFISDPQYGGCSILLGVPTYWRTLGGDTDGNPELHAVIKRADIVHPWYVSRHNEKNFPNFAERVIKGDVEWCAENGLDYVPVLFPGFSWKNMHPTSAFNMNPRNGGSFLWKQITKSVEMGAKMIYFAMFDEIDEGTAIFKVSNTPPVGESQFLDIDGMPSDWYLRLAGLSGQLIRGEIKPTVEIPLER